MNKKRIKVKSTSLTNILIVLLFAFASLDLFQYEGRTFFFYIGLIFTAYVIIVKNRGKLYVINDYLIVAIFLEFFISGIFAQIGDMDAVYKKTAIVMPLLVLPIYFEVGLFDTMLCENRHVINWIIKGLKIACCVQFVYMPIQYIVYHVGGVDINKLLFEDTLGIVKGASFIRDWVWYPSGFTNHSAILAPLLILGIILFGNAYFRSLILLDAFISGSSSAIVGVCVTLFLLFFSGMLDRNRTNKVKKTAVLSVAAIAILLALGIMYTDLLSMLADKISYIMTRLFGDSKDSSTSAHLLYFYKYPYVFSKNTIIQNLFGCGYGCSGNIFSILDNRVNIGSWSVESEIMDRIYSLGIVGFVLYYIFLIRILVKGYRIDRRYTIILIAIIIQGFGYNLQWDYVFLIEMIFYLCVKKEINFFEYL